ncbi:hypothetical protein [Liquorilactobacillus satsumensis]|uniref:hypothetical protein n=1 Tax=Liquorilactobacillus satsumensis TaxID=259059 RepID=UPI001E5D35C5|nr:hypothetical protein [Liquorilactobacillus satsumensis]MCC7667450.1 hypothetical protein [Liquorilactobacillus satsumensis]
MINICDEIKDKLSEKDKTVDDISWIGSRDGHFAMSWKDFYDHFKNITYDNGYGGQEIVDDLVVVLQDGSWLERSEYDGAEDFQYGSTPVLDSNSKTFDKIEMSSFFDTLEDLN